LGGLVTVKQRSKVRFDRRIFAERPRNQLPPQGENSFEQLRTLSQLLLLAPIVVLLIIACGHLALITAPQIAFADKPANLTAEYGQWGFLQVRSVRKEIIAEIRRDLGELPDAGETFALPIPKLGFAWLEEPSSPVVIAALPTIVPTEPTIVPPPVNNQYASMLPPSSPVPTTAPDTDPTKSTTPTVIPSATDPNYPTNTPGPSPTPTDINSPTSTPGPSPTPTQTSSGPQPTKTPLPTATSTDEPASSPTATMTSSPPPTATSTSPPPTPTATTAPTMAPTATSTPGGSASWWNSCYSYRKQVTVMTAGAGVNEGYTGKLNFNHSSLVSAGKSRSDGADVRLVWQSDSNLIQLDRLAAPYSAWNRSNTEIYFKLAAGLPPYSSDGKYFLYYGCSSPGTPPQDANDVYWYSNRFNTDNALSGWTQRDVQDVGVWEVRSGHLEHESDGRQSSQVPYINHKFVLTGKPVIQNLVVNVEFMMRDNDLFAVGLCSNDNSPSGFYVGFSADRWFDDDGVSSRTGYWKNAASSGYSNTTLSMGPIYRPTIAWTSSQILNSFNGNNYQWGAGPSSANYFCFATNSMDVALDDLYIREYVNPEPVSSLGSEEAQ
jgi:hypothetical protein